MILTPSNRYGLGQSLTLAVWPHLDPVLRGSWRQYRGIRVERLGAAMAAHLWTAGRGFEALHWPEIVAAASAQKGLR
jgi:hypothetical protein